MTNDTVQNQIELAAHWRQFCIAILTGKMVNLGPLDIPHHLQDDFIQFLHRHGLETLLIDLMDQNEITNLLPKNTINHLTKIRRDTHIKEIYRAKHLQKFLDLLAKAETKCLVLKGAALAHSFYQHPFQRPHLDTDILIEQKDKDKINQLLLANGFIKSTNISGKLISHQNTYRQIDLGIAHAYDIHWKISNRNAYADLFDFNKLYERKITLSGSDFSFYTLDEINTFLHLTVHYFGHRSDERDRLIWVYDLHLIANKFSNQQWDSLLEISNHKRLDPLIKHLLELCKNTLATEIPQHVFDRLKQSRIQLSEIEFKRLNAEQWTRIDQFKSDWDVFNFKQRCLLLKEYLLPPSDFILKQNNSTNKLLLPYFYIRRIVTGGIKLIGK